MTQSEALQRIETRLQGLAHRYLDAVNPEFPTVSRSGKRRRRPKALRLSLLGQAHAIVDEMLFLNAFYSQIAGTDSPVPLPDQTKLANGLNL